MVIVCRIRDAPPKISNEVAAAKPLDLQFHRHSDALGQRHDVSRTVTPGNRRVAQGNIHPPSTYCTIEVVETD